MQVCRQQECGGNNDHTCYSCQACRCSTLPLADQTRTATFQKESWHHSPAKTGISLPAAQDAAAPGMTAPLGFVPIMLAMAAVTDSSIRKFAIFLTRIISFFSILTTIKQHQGSATLFIQKCRSLGRVTERQQRAHFPSITIKSEKPTKLAPYFIYF